MSRLDAARSSSEFRLLSGREVSALIDLVKINELVTCMRSGSCVLEGREKVGSGG